MDLQTWASKWKLESELNNLIETGYDIPEVVAQLTPEELSNLIPNLRPGDRVKFGLAVKELHPQPNIINTTISIPVIHEAITRKNRRCHNCHEFLTTHKPHNQTNCTNPKCTELSSCPTKDQAYYERTKFLDRTSYRRVG